MKKTMIFVMTCLLMVSLCGCMMRGEAVGDVTVFSTEASGTEWTTTASESVTEATTAAESASSTEATHTEGTTVTEGTAVTEAVTEAVTTTQATTTAATTNEEPTTEVVTETEATTTEATTEATTAVQCVHEKWYTSPDYTAGFSYYTGLIDYPCPVEGCNGIIEIPNDSFTVELEVIPDGLAVHAIGGLHTDAKVYYWTEGYVNNFWEMRLEDLNTSPVEYYGVGSFGRLGDHVIRIKIDVRDWSGWMVWREYAVTFADGVMVLEEIT